ncbi:amino acid ABC transporter substrate-binding protein [Salipiger sp. P9]|uniref:amino acid ABC transporter substrate-binding protein n=1 Tax=Salipiger pentaromativorans TaxID=2943193 RepID=UPI0021577743|nr:amino acid ABC transporter substrate-binding protein [Salipiger pentaromativorans]MCR8547527.1 amino acid ABC transporter substrate-binding protein [Salipiger pentaromativorans]
MLPSFLLTSSSGRALTAAAVTACLATPVLADQTLDAVKERGVLKCGTALDVPGFGYPDSNGVPGGMDVDYCKALAAAVLGDAEKVEFIPLTTTTRFPALQSGEVDVLFRQVTTTFTRDTSLGFLSGPVTVFDGQGIMVPKALGVTKATELDGATVCVTPGSNSELTIGDYFRANGMEFKPISMDNFDEMRSAFFSGRCDVFTSDRTYLGSIRSVAENPDDYVVLDETLAKSPLAPVVRQGDDQWYNIVRWTVYAPMIAEEIGITSENVDDKLSEGAPMIQRFLGKQAEFFEGIGLEDDWAYNVVKSIGNYGELYERNLGAGSAIGLDRGDNNLYFNGGLHYPPPLL